MASDGIEEIHTAGHVGGVKDAWLADGLSDEGFGGKVHYGVNFVLREDGLKLRAIPQIDLAECCIWRHSSAVAFEQAVESDDAHPARE